MICKTIKARKRVRQYKTTCQQGIKDPLLDVWNKICNYIVMDHQTLNKSKPKWNRAIEFPFRDHTKDMKITCNDKLHERLLRTNSIY